MGKRTRALTIRGVPLARLRRMGKSIVRLRALAAVALLCFTTVVAHAAPYRNPTRQAELKRYFPKDVVDTSTLPTPTFEALLDALERIDPSRPPINGGEAATHLQHIRLVESRTATEIKVSHSRERSMRNPAITSLGISSVEDVTIFVPRMMTFPTRAHFVNALGEFLLREFPRNIVNGRDLSREKKAWNARMNERRTLRTKLDSYLPNYHVRSVDAPLRTLVALVAAFEALEPLRPPVVDEVGNFTDGAPNDRLNIIEDNRLEVKITHERTLDLAGFNGPDPFQEKQLSIPRSSTTNGSKDATESRTENDTRVASALKELLLAHFRIKPVPARDYDHLKRDWTKRMVAQGSIAAPPSLVQRAKFYMFGRTCEALFR